MLRKLISIFKNKELRGRILFTLVIILIYRIGCTIVVPGVDSSSITFQENDLFTLMNVLGGGSLASFSLFALGISPYITASIIVQLLSMGILKSLQDLTKEGEKGRKKIDQATRYTSLVLAALQGYGIIMTMKTSYGLTPVGGGDFTTWDYIYITTILVAGSMLVMWLADKITQRGIGNGVSMIIFIGIVASIPNQLQTAYNTFVTFDGTSSEIFTGLTKFGIYLISYFVMIIFVTFIEKSVRKVPLQQSQNTIKMGGDVHHFPVKLNPAGVMPVIFASSFMMAIVTIINVISTNISNTDTQATLNKIASIFNYSTPVDGVYWGLIIYIVLIFAFTFFWTNLQLNIKDISEKLQKENSFIPGIRQGKELEKYLFGVINRVAFVGALVLILLAAIPVLLTIIFKLNSAIAFGGTSVIILVGVAIETYAQIEAKLAGKDYNKFM
jgi:preprotein translocase subunit SecY